MKPVDLVGVMGLLKMGALEVKVTREVNMTKKEVKKVEKGEEN